MYIPSYDDLTPPIPDVAPADVFDVAAVVPTSALVTSSDGDAALKCGATYDLAGRQTLFACLRTARAAEAIFAIAKDFSPRIQRYGGSSIVLDVSGLGRLLGDAPAIAAELQREARERSKGIHVTIAPTQVAALLLAYAQPPVKSGPVVVAAGRAAIASALAPLPLDTLRHVVEEAFGRAPALHEKTFDVLRRWGLTTLGEFVSLPSVELSERLGQSGLALQRLACGVDPSPLVPDPGVPRFVQSIELEWPIAQLEALSFVLARLLDPLSLSLERADRGAAAIHLDLRLVDRTMHARVLQLPAAMRDPRVLRTLLLLDLESHPPSAGIDVVTIEVDPAPSRIIQYSLLERARPSAETLATLTARLNALVGESRVGTPLLLDTHRPDAFEMRRFAPREPGGRGAGGPGSGDGRSRVGFPSAPWLPGPPAPCLRRFRLPVAIRVTVDRGRPVAVAIDRRGMPGGRVERAAGPWRTSGAWWDGGSTGSPQCDTSPWDRDEWDIELSDSSLCRIFHDRRMEKWFLDGVVD